MPHSSALCESGLFWPLEKEGVGKSAGICFLLHRKHCSRKKIVKEAAVRSLALNGEGQSFIREPPRIETLHSVLSECVYVLFQEKFKQSFTKESQSVS